MAVVPFWNVYVKVTDKYFMIVQAATAQDAKQAAKDKVAAKTVTAYDHGVTANAATIDPEAIP
jgi:hypothetical protein